MDNEQTLQITNVALPEAERGRKQKLSFYLAMEEYVAQRLNNLGECFFLWQVEPTVIIGRNQVLENEVNLPYCHKHGIDIVRRKSGGGAVYADSDNLMFSYISPRAKEQTTPEVFSRYLQLTVKMLRSMGVEACTTDHNDIHINGLKVSGYAVYQMQDSIVVHGTMLYDTNMQNMLNAITPSAAKLARKGVESVRQRICFLKDHIGNRMNMDELKEYALQYICSDNSYTLSEDDIAQIKNIQKEFLEY